MMFTDEEMKQGDYTEEDVECIKQFRKIVCINLKNIKESEENIKMIMRQSADVWKAELETYPGRTDRKIFVMITPDILCFKGSFVVPLVYMRFLLNSVEREKGV